MFSDPIFCYIAVGSNEGERVVRCEEAAAALAKLPQTTVTRRSAWYETEPVIDPAVHVTEDRPQWFINGVIEVQTKLSAPALFHQCLRIEQQMGRIRIKPKALSRPIDLDLLLHGDTVMESEELTLPHPRLHLRRFVLMPLAELAPTLKHPTLRLTIDELLKRLSDRHQVKLASPAAQHE
ncbi:MAG: 2-amino-4-hydroxy-6-hydroxymethyldihydropteridine diphosphokinase [Nitrospirota bacterium]